MHPAGIKGHKFAVPSCGIDLTLTQTSLQVSEGITSSRAKLTLLPSRYNANAFRLQEASIKPKNPKLLADFGTKLPETGSQERSFVCQMPQETTQTKSPAMSKTEAYSCAATGVVKNISSRFAAGLISDGRLSGRRCSLFPASPLLLMCPSVP